MVCGNFLKIQTQYNAQVGINSDIEITHRAMFTCANKRNALMQPKSFAIPIIKMLIKSKNEKYENCCYLMRYMLT